MHVRIIIWDVKDEKIGTCDRVKSNGLVAPVLAHDNNSQDTRHTCRPVSLGRTAVREEKKKILVK